jgi:hypothetical protein
LIGHGRILESPILAIGRRRKLAATGQLAKSSSGRPNEHERAPTTALAI